MWRAVVLRQYCRLLLAIARALGKMGFTQKRIRRNVSPKLQRQPGVRIGIGIILRKAKCGQSATEKLKNVYWSCLLCKRAAGPRGRCCDNSLHDKYPAQTRVFLNPADMKPAQRTFSLSSMTILTISSYSATSHSYGKTSINGSKTPPPTKELCGFLQRYSSKT